MWCETVDLRTRLVSDQKKIGLGLSLANFGFDLGIGLAGLVLCCETRFCYAHHHNDFEGHNNFTSTIYSFSVLCLEHHYCGDNNGVYLLKS